MLRQSIARYGMVWFGLVLVTSASAVRRSHCVIDLDLWHELALAREAVRLGAVPQTDSFAYTPTISPVVDHEWGAGMIAYWALSLGGAAGIVVLTFGALAAACMFSVACATLQKGDERILALAGVVVAPLLAIGYAPVRAQAYSFVFFASLLFAIELDRKGKRPALPAWCLMFVAWVNCHASCVLAFAVLGLYWLTAVRERKRSAHILGVIALCAGLIMVNPYGSAMYQYILRAVLMPRPSVEEWAPAWHGGFARLLPPILISLPLLAYAVWQRRAALLRRTALLLPAAIILTTAAFGLIHAKLLPYYAVAVIAYSPGLLGATAAGAKVSAILTKNRRAVRATWALVILAALATLGILRFWVIRVPGQGEAGTRFAVGAVQYLARVRFEGALMTSFNDGAYASWKLYPRVRVSMDSRYEVAYPVWLAPMNEAAYDKGDWRGFVGKYPTDAILAPRDSPMENALAGAWKRVYRDGAYALFVRPGMDLPAVDYGSRTFEGRVEP
jgi:hypothetical protein